MKLFKENITEYFAHAQTVCTRPLLGGGGGGVRLLPVYLHPNNGCTFVSLTLSLQVRRVV